MPTESFEKRFVINDNSIQCIIDILNSKKNY